MKVEIASLSKKGSRSVNQDTIGIYTDDRNICLIVCDGLGAYEDSEKTSKICVDTVIGKHKAATALDDAVINGYFQAAHNAIIAEKERGAISPQSCTTATCLVSDGHSTYIAHTGDSRAYHFKAGKRLYLTFDHSLARERLSGKANPDVRYLPDRHKLTRVVGGSYFVLPEIYKTEQPLSEGDAFLLCTDGFWEHLTDEEIAEAALLCRSPHDALERLENLLLSRIDEQTGDNYSAILAFVF